MAKLAYVVRTENDVIITEEQPKEIQFFPGKKDWFFKNDPSWRFSVGEHDHHQLLYTDNPWIGPIGVYDISKPGHVLVMMRQVKAHLNYIKYRHVMNLVAKISPVKAVREMVGHELITAGPETDWTEIGQAIRDGFGASDCFNE